MTTDKTPATLDAVRNLIVCDTQFGWNGETTLKLPELLDLQERGWMIEGDDNSEFELTNAGREVVARALQNGAPATLATAKHGGCVQLGDGLLPCPFCGGRAERIDLGPGSGDNEGGSCVACTGCQSSGPVEFGYKENFISDWNRRALSAQPSPGGQDALKALDDLAAFCSDDTATVDRHVAVIRAALAARQPVGEPIAWRIVYPEGNRSRKWSDGPGSWPATDGALGLRFEYAYAAPPAQQDAQKPAQAVDLPYSLDADPAGIRARAADAITGTLMVGAQDHTPPPAGHWAEPFWQAARADARVQEKTREALLAAAKSLRTIADSTNDTEFLETAGEIRAYANSRANCAEQAVTDSQAVGNG